MARNVVDDALHDVAQLKRDKQAEVLAKKLGEHTSQLYHAEVVGLLARQSLLDAVKRAAQGHQQAAQHVYDQDKSHEQKGRAESVPALEHKLQAADATAAVEAIKDGEEHQQDVLDGWHDGIEAAGEKNMWPTVYLAATGHPRSVYLERFLYEIKLRKGLSFLKTVNPQETRTFLGQALGMAENDGLISGSEVVANAKPGNDIEGPDPLTMNASLIVGDPMRASQNRLQKAEEKIQQLEEQLHIALQEITPVIADENKVDQAGSIDNKKVKTFITTYRSSPEYKAAEFELSEARKALGSSLHDHEADLAAHAQDTKNPIQAKHAHEVILDSYASLAASDQPRIAMEWVHTHRNDPAYTTPADKKRLDNIDHLANDTAGSIAMRDLKKIFESSAQPQTKFDEAIAYVDSHVCTPYIAFDKLNQLAQIPVLLKKQKAVWEIKGAKDSKVAEEIAKAFIGEGVHEASLAKKINTTLGVLMLGINGTHSLQAGGAAMLKHGADIRDFYAKSREFRELLHKGAEHGEEAATLAKEVRGSYFKLSRGFGALALVGDAYALNNDWNLAQQSPAAYGMLAGDLIATVGDAMTLIPGLEPLGEAISIVGNAVSLIASAFLGDPVGDRRRLATKETLVDGGLLDPQQAGAATHNDSAGNIKYANTLTGNAALSPRQLQQLLETHDFLFKTDKMIEAAHGLWRFYIGNKRNSFGFELQSPYRDSFFAFLNGGDPHKMEYPVIYARSYTRNGIFEDADMSGFGGEAAVRIRDAFPNSAFKR